MLSFQKLFPLSEKKISQAIEAKRLELAELESQAAAQKQALFRLRSLEGQLASAQQNFNWFAGQVQALSDLDAVAGFAESLALGPSIDRFEILVQQFAKAELIKQNAGRLLETFKRVTVGEAEASLKKFRRENAALLNRLGVADDKES